MITIKKDGYVFSVDIEKTKKNYETHSLCMCADCRNYYAQIKSKYPKLDSFLSGFGVDTAKPDEISCVDGDNCTEYIIVDYTVCGNIKETGKSEIEIYDSSFISIVFTNGYVSPNEQTGEYFTVSVMQIVLPWVLDELFKD